MTTKYKNKRLEVDGIKFDSRREYERYKILWTYQKCGLIKDLKLQVPFVLAPKVVYENGVTKRSLRYVADFVYFDIEKNELVIEDVKGFKTAIYLLKKHLMKHLLGLEIRET